MNLIVLAAGYATRLHPLTLNQPKPLLPVAGRPMLEHVLHRVLPVGEFESVFVVTNARFAAHFEDWARSQRSVGGFLELIVINDGTTDDSNKLGAIGDLHLVLERQHLDSDLVVVAGDNLFSESLADFGHYCRERRQPVVAVYDVGDLATARRYNSISVGPDGRITYFQEKPDQPTSTLTGIALYYYPREMLPLIRQYVREGNNPDQPGRLIEWLYSRMPVFTWPVPGTWFDIGTRESLAEADRYFTKPT